MGEAEQSTGVATTLGQEAREPLRVRVDEEPRAAALADTLGELAAVELRPDGAGWEVVVDYAGSGPLLVSVLNAIRDALAGQSSASALVLFDGHEYWMRGE
jgi:hypothetical protein